MNKTKVKAKALVESIRYCMMTTITPEGRLQSRPMTAQTMDDDGFIWFFAREDSETTDSLNFDENVNLAFSSIQNSEYLSIVGTAELVKDRKKIEELWTPIVKAFFPDGQDDPTLCLIRVHAISAEYWESPSSKVIQLFGMAKAVLTGTTYTGSEHERSRLP